jgi:hypothetical protein
METEMELDDAPTRQSSKFSLGSSLSVLSADEQLDGEGPLTPTDKIQDGEDDDMSDLNSLIDSTGTLSNAEVTDDEDMLLDNHSEHDSASPLSSIPDDFPLSRSASPEINEQEPSEPLQDEQTVLKENEAADSKNIKSQVEEDEEEEEDDEEEEEEPVGTTSTRGRRKEAITRQQKLKQQKQKTNNNRMVKSAAKDKENEKETGSRRKRTKRESPIDKAEESKAKKQRTSEPKSRKGLNKQRKEKEIEQEDDDQDEGEDDGFDQEKKEETKMEENVEADQQDKAEKEILAESSNDGADNNNNNDQDENKENIEQNDPEIKVDPQGNKVNWFIYFI